MAYDQQKFDIKLVEAVTLANGTVGAYAIGMAPFQVSELWATLTVAVSTASSVLTFQFRPVAGVAANQVVLGVLNLPVTVAVAGRQYYKRVTPFKCLPGGDIAVVASGGAVGNASLGVGGFPSWDSPNVAQFLST